MSKRQSGGGGLMVWGAFSCQGKTDLCFVEGIMDSEKYCVVLEAYLLLFGANEMLDSWVYQQDNAPIHKLAHTMQWLGAHNIPCLKWPSKSPNLNPIENLWGILVRDVYDNGRRQFLTKDHLRLEIVTAWN